MDDNIAKKNKKLSITLIMITIVVVSLMEFLMSLLCPTRNCTIAKPSANSIALTENENTNFQNLNYENYSNFKYGFSLKYPSFLANQTLFTNGDGAIFKNGDSTITLIAWGENNIFDQTPRIAYENELKLSKNITHKYISDNYYIIQGIDENKFYYKHSIVGPASINSFLIKYPKSMSKKIHPIINEITNSFKVGNLYENH